MNSGRKNRAVALTGILCALCIVFLYLGSIVEVLDYSVSALCGILVTLAVVELGTRAGLAVWLGSSFLSLLLLPSKFSSLLFILFCGWYSFAKKIYEKKKPFVCVLLKLLTFNAVLALIAFITVKLFLAEILTLPLAIAMAIISNVTFLIYDALLTRLIYLYVIKWRRKLRLDK